MASEIRVDTSKNASGLCTVTYSNTGAVFSGISTFAGDVYIPDKIIHSGDTNTAIRFPATDQISFETAGSERLRIAAGGNFGIGDLSNVSNVPQTGLHYANSSGIFRIHNTTNDFYSHIAVDSGGSLSLESDAGNGSGSSTIIFKVDTSEKVRITSGGKTLIHGGGATGANDTATILENGNTLNIHGTSSSDGISVVRYSANYGAYGINIGKSRNNTFGTNTLVQDGNELGHISFYGADGTDFEMAAQITAKVDGDPATGGDGTDMPGALSFRTTPEGSDSPTEKLRIFSDGDVGIGTDTMVNDSKVHLWDGSTSNYRPIVIDSAATNGSTLVYRQLGTQVISIGSGGGNNLSGSSVTHGLIRSEVATVFAVGNSEKLRIASDGEVFIGEGFGATNRSTLLSVSGAHQDPAGVWAQVGLYSSDSQAASKGGSISFGGQDGTTSKSVFAAILGAKENSTSGNYAGYMAFYTRPAGAVSKERLRISSTGAALMGTTSNPNLSGSYSAGTIVIDVNHTSNANAIIVSDMTQNNACLLTQPFTNHTYYAGYWTSWDGTNEGEIAVSTKNGGTQYQTSSDYRRKENLVNITDGITQVKALKPYRFNMIGTPDVIRQGFLAHEVQEILPEAVSGVKDGIAAEDDGLHKKGEPIYQGLDYGRLTPILTAALKELIAEVDTLKTKVAALEG